MIGQAWIGCVEKDFSVVRHVLKNSLSSPLLLGLGESKIIVVEVSLNRAASSFEPVWLNSIKPFCKPSFLAKAFFLRQVNHPLLNERRVLENQSSNLSFFTLEDPEWTSLLEGLSLNPLRKLICLLIQWILKLQEADWPDSISYSLPLGRFIRRSCVPC